MQLIDTHVHINFDVFESDLDVIRTHWQQAGVVHLIHSCVEPAEFPKTQALADQFPELSLSVGLHPLDADQWTPAIAEQIFELASGDPRVVAIGEMGLDLYKATNLPQQILAFESQLEIAYQLQKPIIVHCRDAAEEMASRMRDFWQKRGPLSGVMHCWGGTVEQSQWFLDLGFYMSFSGIITFKNAKQVQTSAQFCPSDRLLIETDCPFLAPAPVRGKRNEPAYVRYVAEQLASLRGVSLETIAAQTTENARRLFAIDN